MLERIQAPAAEPEDFSLPTPLTHIFEDKSILVCVGSGGVGKTTTAAAIGLRAALDGKRALVMTIDPAKRLANALGLTKLGHSVQQVDDTLLDAAAAAEGRTRTKGGLLFAMMLDQKQAFDDMVAKHASDPEAIKRIIANPVYAQISGSLAGAQEYAAMAVLHELDEQGEYDVLVVDTPPTSHALDFLDAPQKLTQAIDSAAIEWFRRLASDGGRSWSVVGRSGSYVLKKLSTFVGTQFIQDLAVFFTEFNDILGGFRVRAEETFKTLRHENVGFVLVASPEPMAIREALYFHERLVSSSMPFSAFVVNKVHADRPMTGGIDTVRAELATACAGAPFADSTITSAANKLVTCHQELQILAEADRESVETLTKVDPAVVEIPFLTGDIHDLEQLVRLSHWLF